MVFSYHIICLSDLTLFHSCFAVCILVMLTYPVLQQCPPTSRISEVDILANGLSQPFHMTGWFSFSSLCSKATPLERISLNTPWKAPPVLLYHIRSPCLFTSWHFPQPTHFSFLLWGFVYFTVSFYNEYVNFLLFWIFPIGSFPE